MPPIYWENGIAEASAWLTLEQALDGEKDDTGEVGYWSSYWSLYGRNEGNWGEYT